jgi:hypothetical protein
MARIFKLLNVAKKTIALIDWSWAGHHATYFYSLTREFINIGCDVLPLCPEFAIQEVKSWRHEGKGAGVIHEPIPVGALRLRQSVLPHFLRGPEQAITGFGRIGKQLRKWERTSRKKIDLVFFTTIYDIQFLNFNLASRLLGHPWSGIYLHSRSFRMPGKALPNSTRLPRPEQIFQAPGMSSICVLDEGIVDSIACMVASKKPVLAFPDITLTETIEKTPCLAQKIRAFAGGRKLVVCIGYLYRAKGMKELCMAAMTPALKDIVFLFAGEVDWTGFTDEERRFIRSAWENSPNIMTHLQRIEDERMMNKLIREADLVYAAYIDFPNSSNVMTKAAFYRKPILVSDGYLMAERTRMHRLGAIVPEGSVSDVVEQIRYLCDHGGKSDADYEGYYAKHSPEALKQALQKVLNAIK